MININKISFLTLLFGLLLLGTSCDMFKPAQDTSKDKVYKDSEELGEIKAKKRYNPETGEWEMVQEVSTKLDTVEWKTLPPNKFPPITSDGELTDIPTTGNTGAGANGSIMKGSYDVTMLLPFNTQYSSEQSIDNRSKWAVNFYAGSKMALDALREEGLNLRVEVLDTRGDQNRVRNYLATNQAVQSADAIIGPYRRNNVNLVAEWAKKGNTVVVSPFSASMNITTDNPNYLQVNPSIESHVRAIMQHALSKYQASEMVIVAREDSDERNLASLMQQANAELSGKLDATPRIEEYIVEEKSADFNEMQLLPLINPGQTTVFLVPSYKSETFVYALLRKLAIGKKMGDRIVVYGLPTWQGFERVDFDYYENLNVHVSAGSFVDSYNPEVRLFKQKYFDRYKMPPTDEAVLGYDVTVFTGRMLKKYGTKFPLSLELESNLPYLQSGFSFERVIDNPTGNDNQMNQIDYFENKSVHILKFDNYYFQPAD